MRTVPTKSGGTRTDYRERQIKATAPRADTDLKREAERVTAAGEDLARTLHLRHLAAYQELVRDFLTAVVAQAYRLRREVGRDRRGRARVFQIVLKVDEALADLAQAVLEGEQARLRILARLDEIRGLLVDLYR